MELLLIIMQSVVTPMDQLVMLSMQINIDGYLASAIFFSLITHNLLHNLLLNIVIFYHGESNVFFNVSIF